MIDPKLDYLKEKFLENSKLNFIFSDSPGADEYELSNFSKKIPPLIAKISKAESIDELKSGMLEIRESYLESWKVVRDNKDTSHTVLYDYFFKSGINLVDEWVDNQSNMYENKKSLGFFEKTASALKNIFGIKEEKKNEDLSEDTLNLGKEIINKFNLTYINLSSYSSNKDCLEFLNKFNKNASIAFEKLGVLPEVLGIHKSFSISSNTSSQAFCQSAIKEISLDINCITPTTILHEWVHGLDNYVCEKTTGLNEYVSERETTFFEDERFPITQAYKEIRDLTQSLYNENKDAINIVKDTIVKENTAKFYSIIMGNDWYTLSEDKRDYLMSKNSINKVNNFFSMNTNSGGYLHVEEELCAQFSAIGINLDASILSSKRKEIDIEIKPFFETVNQNFIHGKSLYYIGCQISNHIAARPAIFFNSQLDKVKNWLGVEDKSTETNFDREYFSKSCEMLARYFESQVFPKAAKTFNLLSFAPIYKITKDENFEKSKDTILEHVFGKDKILKNITNIRKEATLNTSDNEAKMKI